MRTLTRLALRAGSVALFALPLAAQSAPRAPDASERAALCAASDDSLGEARAASAMLARSVSTTDRAELASEAARSASLAEMRASITNDDTTLILVTAAIVVLIILIV